MTDIVFAPRPAYAHRARGAWPPSLFIIHATRGHTPLDLQDQATVNWFTGLAPDNGGWASTADALVSADEDRCWIFERSLADLRTFHSAWSAGYGRYGSSLEWGADERAISIEVAQTPAEESYSDDTLRRLAFLVRTIEDALGFKVPRQHVRYWDQRRDHEVPRGFIGHEELENGRKTGKSDPGAQFPWDRFLWLVGQEEDDMQTRSLDDVQKARLGAFLEPLVRTRFTQLVNTDPGDGFDIGLADTETHDVVVLRLPKGTVTK